MGTTSLTTIHVDNRPLVAMLCQYDGYPLGHGSALLEFLTSVRMVRGLGSFDTKDVANGADCLAAQMICHFKTGPGGVYLDLPGTRRDYNYDLFYTTSSTEPDRLTTVKVQRRGDVPAEVLLSGTFSDFMLFIERLKAAES